MTTIKMTRCLTYHVTSRTSKKQLQEHKNKLTRNILKQNTENKEKFTDHRQISILEVLYIKEFNPTFKLQITYLRVIARIREQEETSHLQATSNIDRARGR